MNDEILITRLKDKQCIICGREVKKDEEEIINHSKLGKVLVHRNHNKEKKNEN
jgi:hypothetical protein